MAKIEQHGAKKDFHKIKKCAHNFALHPQHTTAIFGHKREHDGWSMDKGISDSRQAHRRARIRGQAMTGPRNLLQAARERTVKDDQPSNSI